MNSSLAEQLVAHRGYRARYPENTLTSIKAAIDAGARHIEFDVQMNADLVLVVIHDDTFARTGNSNQSLFETGTVDTLSQSAHEPNRFAQEFYPENVLLLSDVLSYCRRYEDITLYIDVKTESLEYWGRRPVMDSLFEVLREFPNPVYIISFDHVAINYCLESTRFQCGWILKKYDNEHFAIADKLRPHMLVCNRSKIPDEGPLHEGNWTWMLYGIETADEVLSLHARGIDLFETDYIGEVRHALMMGNPG